MNGTCEVCHRDDICLCALPDDPTAAAVEILDVARDLARGAHDPGVVFAYDGPYANSNLRPAGIEKPAPYLNGAAPNGAYIFWLDLPQQRPSWISTGGWVRETFDPEQILTHAIVRLQGQDGVEPDIDWR